MKYSTDWGNGKIINRIDPLKNVGRKTYSGGSGFVLTRPQLLTDRNTFCLKCVPLLQNDGTLNKIFWNEAQSVSVYTSVVRKIPGCAACPIPAQYWIHENDPLFLSFPRQKMSTERPKSLTDFISIFDIRPEDLLDIGFNPAEYWLVPQELLKTIYDSHKLAVETEKYKLPSELYNKLFASKIKCDLLLTYPIQQGQKSLDKGILDGRESGAEDAQTKEAQEISKMIYQILSAILGLYRNGVAHGDIKPANIMMGRRMFRLASGISATTNFFLTDMGSIHAGDLESETGSGRFFNFSVFEKWKNIKPKTFNRDYIGEGGFYPENKMLPEELKSLLCRTLMDGYALALTIWSQAKGSAPTSSLVNRALVEKWQNEKITYAFNTLYDVSNLTIEKMQKIVDLFAGDRSTENMADDYNCIETYGRESEFPFEVKYREEIEKQTGSKSQKEFIEYGYLQEQINFSGKVNPMLRIKGRSRRYRLDDFSMQPLICSRSNGDKPLHTIYYAPDDIAGSRAVEWEKYTPFSLDWVLSDSENRAALTDDLYRQLLDFGRKIDEKYDPDNYKFALPYPRDIVKIDNKWFIQPFFLSPDCYFNRNFKVEEYFKMLCGREENKLSAIDWLDLLKFDHGVGILFELLPDSMVPEIIKCLPSYKIGYLSRKLLETAKFKNYTEGESLPLQANERVRTAKFRKYTEGESLPLQIDERD